MMKTQNTARTTVVCIAAFFILIMVPISCSVIGTERPAGSILPNGHAAGNSEACAGAYGAFCICDAKGRTFDVCAACRVREDGCADLYLLQGTAADAWLTAESEKPDSLVIDAVRWFVCEGSANTAAFFERIPVCAVYEQGGTLQTIGADHASARLIWAES